MSDKDFVELSFRFRPKVHRPDRILVRDLLSCKPSQRCRIDINSAANFLHDGSLWLGERC